MANINEIKSIIGAKARPVIEATTEGTAALKEHEQKLVPIPVKEALSNNTRSELTAFIKTLVEGLDYGSIPKIKGKVLFKPGELKILNFLKLRYSVNVIDKTVSVPDKFIGYTVKIIVTNCDGDVVRESIGAANSLEAKFEKAGFSSDNLICRMAAKRALVAAVKEIIA